jgi:GNAT superfamily N-acetyltransferase
MNMPKQHHSTTIYYLEMLDPQALRPKQIPDGLEVSMVRPPSPALNRWFYETVGKDWKWTDRLVWTEDDWNRYVHRPTLQTWVGKYRGQTAGYFELECQPEGNVEIAYFGLLPEFVGRGLGAPLLTAAVQRAWQLPDVRRVWVHTCTNDHPAALSNYECRGFRIYKKERAP